MKLGLMQPYFFPYIGYFQLIAAVDTYVVYDDVKYINDGWIHRNRILLNGAPAYINLPVKKDSNSLLINQRELSATEWEKSKAKLLGQLHAAYRKAPHYDAGRALVAQVLDADLANLGLFLFHSLQIICNYLEIRTPLILSSALDKRDDDLKGTERVINVCKLLQADTYLNAIGGRELYNAAEFAAHGITLQFVKTGAIEYKQFDQAFVPHLSIIDVVMFNDRASIAGLLKRYELVSN